MAEKLDHLSEFNRKRKNQYKKNLKDEEFLKEVNEVLREREEQNYERANIEHPFVFVFGLPRSGTTLLSQLLAYSLNIGYVNNFIARFWLAPVTGIRLFRILYGDVRSRNFQSDYATTQDLTGIHEFGYFWRHWLNKEKISDITDLENKRQEINWDGLKTILANMQREFGKGICCKNIFGSYHMSDLVELLNNVLFVYIERDPLDVALSILEARKKYYDDLNLWWSYAPPEYNQIKDLPYQEQIGGQIYYLKRFYDKESRKLPNHVMRVKYGEVCKNPQNILDQVRNWVKEQWNYELQQIQTFSDGFPYRTYHNRDKEKREFKHIIQLFEEKENEPLFDFNN
jgi:hypothetical protein